MGMKQRERILDSQTGTVTFNKEKGRECIQKHGFETDLTRFHHFWKTEREKQIMVVNTWLGLNVFNAMRF